MNRNMLVCAVGSRIGVEDTKLIVLDFDWPPSNAIQIQESLKEENDNNETIKTTSIKCLKSESDD